ncbi:MAG: M67 family metallopeptidase [Chloroflexi bacterium]|nr:M67 family metallopeptidase [Chloroflexota bacterium]
MLTIPKMLIAEMITHALEKDPEECCGLVLGKDGRGTVTRRVSNSHENKVSRYTMEPLEVMKVEREADGRGEGLLAIYHSHTYTQAYPSETDIRSAIETGWLDPNYILVSLVEKTRPVMRAYRIDENGSVREVFIKPA